MIYEDQHSLKNLLQIKAQNLGFELFGVAEIKDVPELTLFEKWLALGYAGEMHYLAKNKEKRIDPAKLVENAKSVIMCGAYYHTDAPLSVDHATADSGWIARYAWGDDYHDLLKKRIKSLYAYLQEVTDGRAAGRYYVDTGPVLEKAWAKQAGLGWIGKNTCLINKSKGSFLFLAAIITDVPMVADQPTIDHCGSCTRCLDACPTNALVEPYVLDANLCISYLTIEKKGSIPEHLRDGIGRQIFGCDICQDVCPWNRKAAKSKEPAFQAREGMVNPSLENILLLEENAFREAFRKSPVKRTKLSGLLRNAIIAAGNSGLSRLIPFLKKYVKCDDETLNEHAEWALAKLESSIDLNREDKR
ncbi:tRNA epoxyqueuosine(34) reductase QueG [candidate division KSB1 bacterium]|nr:tRNA epoxyqueuosine(34) reductase QueG [candidate division KSB1 bacterium]